MGEKQRERGIYVFSRYFKQMYPVAEKKAQVMKSRNVKKKQKKRKKTEETHCKNVPC